MPNLANASVWIKNFVENLFDEIFWWAIRDSPLASREANRFASFSALLEAADIAENAALWRFLFALGSRPLLNRQEKMSELSDIFHWWTRTENARTLAFEWLYSVSCLDFNLLQICI